MSARRLRIRTRCTSVDEFVSRYAINTDEESIRLALNRPSDCGTRPFAIFLNNDTPVMWGIANLEIEDPSEARLQFVQLGDDAVAVHERLLAERFSNEPTACWSKLPLPAPPVTRVARRDEVLGPQDAVEPIRVARPRSRVRFAHALAITAFAFFAGSWLDAGAPQATAEHRVETSSATAESPTFSPVITPLVLPLDEPAPRVVADDDRPTRRETRRRRR